MRSEARAAPSRSPCLAFPNLEDLPEVEIIAHIIILWGKDEQGDLFPQGAGTDIHTISRGRHTPSNGTCLDEGVTKVYEPWWLGKLP
jgi:hypothetical protein